MNAFYDPTTEKAFCSSDMRSSMDNVLASDRLSTKDAASANFDRFSSLEQVTSRSYPPLSLCLVNDGYPDAYFRQTNHYHNSMGTTPALYSWCDTNDQKMQAFGKLPLTTW